MSLTQQHFNLTAIFFKPVKKQKEPKAGGLMALANILHKF